MTLIDKAKRKSISIALGTGLALAVGAMSTVPVFAQDFALRGTSLFDEEQAYTKNTQKIGRNPSQQI